MATAHLMDVRIEQQRLDHLERSVACEVVIEQYAYLLKHVDAIRIFPYLLSNKLVELEFGEYLESERTNKDRMARLLRELTRSPEGTWFDRFTNALSKVPLYKPVVDVLLGDFAKLKEERLNSPPSLEDDGMKSPLASTASSDPMTPQFVINVTNTVSGVDTVMQKAMEEAREDHRSALSELQKANACVLEAEKGKAIAEAMKMVLEARLRAANEELQEAKIYKRLLEIEAQSYKDEAREIQQRLEAENAQLSKQVDELHLKQEADRERMQAMEGEREALKRRVVGLEADMRKMMVRVHIGQYVEERGLQDVGVPSLIEAGDCLVKCGGRMNEAIALCARRREEKICELLKRYPTNRKEAARVLTAFKLNVDVAVRDLEKESLSGIMQFIWEQVDQEEIRKIEEDRLEELVKQKKYTDNGFCHRLLMAEFDLDDWDRASLVFELMDKGKAFNICLKVAKNCRTMEEAERFMNQECPVCFDTYLMDEMVAMLHCRCSVCKECFNEHYTMMAHEKNISQFNCLVCAQPDLAATDIDKDDYLMLFAVLLKEHVSIEDYQLFQKKATEFSLLKDTNFRWCAHTECGAGFIHDPPLNKVITCPYCKNKMCYDCKRPWEDQHKGISCKDFTKWKAENDEENQQKGLAAFLKENGLECPKCHCRYDLARGGCLHFKCGQCPTDFCGGCGAIYDKSCRKYKSCANKGFHAHHPRDCLFYLRDWAVERLQKMLTDKKIEFDTEAPEAQVNAARQALEADQKGGAEGEAAAVEPIVGGAAGQLELRCRVILQKEVGTERVDEECGDDCKQGHGGLCPKHYKEYLIFKLNEALIDPADDMDVGELKAVIMREEKPVPEGDENNAQYKERLKEQVKKDFPLDQRGGLNF